MNKSVSTAKTPYPTISIIMPSYNQANFIEQSIKSVIDQNYPAIELIVMDGGSTDGTLSILEKYSEKIIWKSEKDNGQAHAINKGLNMASGQIIGYLNSDDLLEPDSLIRVANVFKQHPDEMWVTGRCRNIDEENTEIRPGVTLYKNLLLEIRNYYLLLIVDFIAQPASFWQREILDKVGNFDETLHYNMDYDFFLRLWKIARPAYLRNYLASFRIHKHAKTASSVITNKYIEEDKLFIRRHTNAMFWLTLHDLHRYLITVIYARLAERSD